MRSIDAIERADNRSRTLRLLMLLIIVGTFPFYCIGVIIIGQAPASNAQSLVTETEDATFTPIGADVTQSSTPTVTTTRLVTETPFSTLGPTPFQYVPPTRVPTTLPTFTPFPTVFIPSPTNAPTLTSVPQVGDSDGDGVNDDKDQCKNTFGPADNNGCP